MLAFFGSRLNIRELGHDDPLAIAFSFAIDGDSDVSNVRRAAGQKMFWKQEKVCEEKPVRHGALLGCSIGGTEF